MVLVTKRNLNQEETDLAFLIQRRLVGKHAYIAPIYIDMVHLIKTDDEVREAVKKIIEITQS